MADTVSEKAPSSPSQGAHEAEQLDERRGYQEWTKQLPNTFTGQIITKLFSNEDGYQIHKTLGILSLISFVYRYFWVYPTTGTLGFDGTTFDWITMALHMLLSSSSLLFHVISHRILSRPMIIWEEYRLHAIIFSTRCFSVYLMGYFRPFKGTLLEPITLGAVVLLHHVGADRITEKYGSKDKTSTTVRVRDDGDLLVKMVLRFYAFYQFSALAGHLVPNDRLMDLGFNTFVAIQSSAFLMTLYRKSIITYRAHAFWYTFCLVISIFHIFRNCASTLFVMKLSVAYMLRVKFNVNKYILWTAFILLSLPPIEQAIKAYYVSHTDRNLDDEIGLVTGQMLAQSLFFFGMKTTEL